jgi:hypothetical protein
MRRTFLPDRARSRAHVNEGTSRCWNRLVPQASPGPGDVCHGTGAGAAPPVHSRGVTERTADLGTIRSLLAATSVTVALGVMMIVLKDVVLIHLH